MKKPVSEKAALRLKAEKLMKKKGNASPKDYQEADMLKLIHELEVHQIELELQNDELRLAKENAEIAKEKFSELYDFSISGYITLSAACKIEMINLAAARMLAKERSRLLGCDFNYFLTHDTQLAFDAFFGKVFNNRSNEQCLVTLTSDGNTRVFVNMEGVISENGKQCFLTLTDISERKLSEAALKKLRELETSNSYFQGRELLVVELKKEVNALLKRLGSDEKYRFNK
ncbi:MAG: PAS domain-containing protein [Bacteroidota bacterium]